MDENVAARAAEEYCECLRNLTPHEIRNFYYYFVYDDNNRATGFNFRQALDETPPNNRMARALVSLFQFIFSCNAASARTLLEREIVRRYFQSIADDLYSSIVKPRTNSISSASFSKSLCGKYQQINGVGNIKPSLERQASVSIT